MKLKFCDRPDSVYVGANTTVRDVMNELANIRALAKLGRWCLEESREHDSSDVDAASLQDKAIELGLLAYEEVAEPCGESCHCLEYEGTDSFPTRCLRYTDRAILGADS